MSLAKVMPKAPAEWLDALEPEMVRFAIDTPVRQAAFLAQIAHESREMQRLEENLNYSAQRLMEVFPNYFRFQHDAELYARKPEEIANKVYANRNGNGGIDSGDGWRYRGRGPIQITGRANYRDCGKAIGEPLEDHPETLLVPAIGCAAACWWWSMRGLNALADAGRFEDLTRRVNGGLNGLADRRMYWARAREVLVA